MLFLKNHPQALPYLFLTEMWERFGFYVVQGMLVLYMAQAFHFSDDASYTIMGVFSALAYIAPFIGGYLADRLLGAKSAIVWGGSFLSAGYAMLALPWVNGFYLSLATIIVGNGLLKPNISSLLGSLYETDDPRREAGFTIFYIGINLGVLLSGLSSGYIQKHLGWHAGFALASIGLIIGLLIFRAGLKQLLKLKHNPLNNVPKINLWTKAIFILGCLTTIYLISKLLQDSLLATWLLPSAGVVLMCFLLIVTYKQQQPFRNRMLSLNALILSSIIFWMIYLQLFFSANLFIDRLVNKHFLGINIPTTVFYALEAVFIILLGPFFAWTWQTLGQSKRNPSAFSKFILAIACVGSAFLLLAISTHFTNADHLVNPLWIVCAYCLITIGELFLSPIGLSAVTTLAPHELMGMMMGIWFVALGFGGQFAGWLAKLASVPENVTDLSAQLTIYKSAFLEYALIAFGVSFILYIMQLGMKKFLPKDGIQKMV
ncbi:MAG: oligopeptide:H+ symporter [Gammaproteobacteria bacterium]|nr:oligopeptide:H+ symporter [Gammaproteobacteria bacterium]